MEDEELEKDLEVVAAAILTDTGEIFSVPKPGRHHNVIALIRAAGKNFRHEDQGFLLRNGSFARRKSALVCAIRAGQLPKDGGKWPTHGLFSEDLW